jgi:hypothetical protein
MFQITLKVVSKAQGQKDSVTIEVTTTKYLDQQMNEWLVAHNYAEAVLKRTGILAFEATVA